MKSEGFQILQNVGQFGNPFQLVIMRSKCLLVISIKTYFNNKKIAGPKKLIFDFSISETGSIRYLGYKAAKCFQHFHYIYNLTRNCKSRAEEFQNNNDTTNTMPKGVIIKIGIVGKFTDDNLNLVSKCKGKELMYQTFISKHIKLYKCRLFSILL